MDFVFGLILTGLLLACSIILMCINSWIKDLSEDLTTIRRLLSTKEYDISSMHPTSIAAAGEFGGNYTETFQKELKNARDRYMMDYERITNSLCDLQEHKRYFDKRLTELEKKMNEIYIEE
jgi:hypothetical protein